MLGAVDGGGLFACLGGGGFNGQDVWFVMGRFEEEGGLEEGEGVLDKERRMFRERLGGWLIDEWLLHYTQVTESIES